MNFQALEWLISSIISGYNCENCKSKIDKNNINIKDINWTSVILEIDCFTCSRKSIIKSEVVSLDLTKYLSEEQLSTIQKTLKKDNKNNITDKEIVELNKNLKKQNINVSDLFE